MEENEKKRAVETRETIYREDGSKVVRVRRRKKKSEYHIADDLIASKWQLLKIGLVVVLVFAIMIAALGTFMFGNSKAYRKNLTNKIEKSTGAMVDLREFRLNPLTANAASLKAEWTEKSIFRELSLNNLHARIFPLNLLIGDFSGREITAKYGELTLNSQRLDNLVSTHEATKMLFHFDRYFVEKMNVRLAPSSELQLLGAEITGFQDENRFSQIRLKGGEIQLKGWSPFVLKRAHVNFKKDQLRLSNLLIRSKAFTPENSSLKSEIRLRGEVAYQQAGQSYSFFVDIRDYPVIELFGPDFRILFDGRVETVEDNQHASKFTLLATDGSLSILDAKLSRAPASKVTLKHFPFLRILGQITQNAWYESPSFSDEARCSLVRKGETVQLNDLALEARSQMFVRGNLESGSGGAISGTLQIGLPISLIETTNDPKLSALFKNRMNGYFWTEIKVSGTGASPIDNFRELYEGSRSSVEIEPTKQGDSFDSLLGK